MAIINTLEDALAREATKNLLPMHAGDVVATYADVEDLKREVGFAPTTTLKQGVDRRVEWYLHYTDAS